jgi:DNA-directed RNA polymerase omega subunit
MAILQSTDELEKYVGNKYSLVILAAKRARQIKEGHTPLEQDKSPNPLTLALREVQAQRLQVIAPPEEEIAPAPRDLITSLVTGAGFDLGDDELDLEDSDAVEDLAALLIGADEEEEEESETETEEDALAPAAAAGADEDDSETEDETADEDEEDTEDDDESVDSGEDEEEEVEE